MRILVTGASGALGRSTVLELHKRFPNAELQAPGRDVFDLLDSQHVQLFIQNYKPTHVVHLAAKVFGIQGHQTFPMDSLLTNTLIDHNLFSSLALHPPEWIYYASTVAAYGYPYRTLPLIESDLLLAEPHISEFGYAQAKRFALTYLWILRRHYETKFVYGLMTNLFSKDDRYLNGNGHVLISLATKALKAKSEGTPLLIWGNGLATRDFLSTESAARIICDLFGIDAGILNIGSGQELSIKNLAAIAVEIFEIEKGYRFTGENEGITHRYSNVEQLRKLSHNAQENDSLSQIYSFFSQVNAIGKKS